VKKNEKAETVEALKAAIAAQRGAVVAEYKGLKVSEITALRKKLRAIDAEVRVVKNTLIRGQRRGRRSGSSPPHFTGPNGGRVFAWRPVAMAKVMKEFAAATPKVTLRAGFVEGRGTLRQGRRDPGVRSSREVLLSRLVGGLASPITRLVQASRAAAQAGVRPRIPSASRSPRKRSPAERNQTNSQNL